MPDGGVSAMFVAVGIVKLGAALLTITGIITGVKYFHTYEYKPKKKGGKNNDRDQFDDIREKFATKY
jgi:hypothetical protein